MIERLRKQGDPDLGRELRGTKVYAVDGEKLGAVDDFLVDPESADLRYLVVNADGLSSRRFLIPADQALAGPDGDDMFVNVTKSDVEQLPEFRDEFVESPDQFQLYEESYRHAWRNEPASSPHPRLQGFRDELRARRFQSAAYRVPVASMPEAVSPLVDVDRPSGVYGLYADRVGLERAVSELKELGFRNDDISVVFPDKEKSKKFAVTQETKAPEGALAGGSTGLVVGGVLGWLVGIGTLALPGLGPLIAAGPIVTAITGAGVGSAIGGIAGALIGLGVPELEAKRYEKKVKEGGMLLSVRCDDPRFAESARKVLQRTGAKDLFVAGTKKAA